MSHRTLVTCVGTPINHWHRDQVEGELSDAQKAALQADTLADYPGIIPVEYIHLDHTVETLLPTRKYNCWGFTFNPRQCWISTGADVQTILNDCGTQVFHPNIRVGDVICYRNGTGTITHTGRVWSLDAAGQPALIQSKWGSLGEYFHPPLTVPASYGTNVTYWRVTPISGKGDTWMKDYPGDDRLVAPPGVDLWLSPDLWVNNSGGAFHENPIRHQPNQIWVRVHNPDTLPVSGARVHVYWSDPTGGMPHTEWHEIGMAPVNLPAGPGPQLVGGPIMWTPGAAEPQHCCLFAIVETGDDPCAWATLDPIVWPFDVARDNNIVWKNVWIVTVPPPPPPAPSPGPGDRGAGGGAGPGDGKLPKPVILDFVARNVFRREAAVEVKVTLRAIEPQEILGMGLSPELAKFAETAVAARKMTAAAPSRAVRAALGPHFTRPNLTVAIAGGEGEPWRVAPRGPLTAKGLVFRTAALAHGKGGRLKLSVSALPGAKNGEAYRIDLVQSVGGLVTGGGTYVIVVRG